MKLIDEILDAIGLYEDEDIAEELVTPDFMCGGYFNNVIVSEGKGSVRPGLTDDEYQGDADMCCEPGKTYDFLHALKGYENDSDTEVIMDNYNCVGYYDVNESKGYDTWSISYAQKVPTEERTKGNGFKSSRSKYGKTRS